MGDRLLLSPLRSHEQARALQLAEMLLAHARACSGKTREDLEEAVRPLLMVPPNERRLVMAFLKLLEDHSIFEASDATISSDKLREELFLTAALRRKSSSGFQFDRNAILKEIGEKLKLTQEQIEQHLYSDLREAQRLKAVPNFSPEELLSLYEQSQAQAVLLRAIKVNIDIKCHSPREYRILFQKIKFLRLLFSVQPNHSSHSSVSGTYHLEITGPFGLFTSTTKYGLKLALLLPLLQQYSQFRMVAQVQWGKTKVPLSFSLEGGQHSNRPKGLLVNSSIGSDESRLASTEQSLFTAEASEGGNPEMTDFLKKFVSLSSSWKAFESSDILHLPGIGLCIPDIQFVHQTTGETIYFELLGYWSREAVWKRVELMQKGFPYKILFAVSKRLRVSEQALDDQTPGMLYVFSETLQAKSVLSHLDKLQNRAGPFSFTFS